VEKFFQTLARLASNNEFSLAKSENILGSRMEESVREEKTLAKLASWFLFLLSTAEFHLHFAIWRVVIPTPGLIQEWYQRYV
jgi:hypothetical protein